jgi:nitrate reductase assembly molybdenum cofactor insertion protein NarJ
MDRLHATLASLRPETKSAPDHLSVFREFLAQLDALQREAQTPRVKPLRKRARRGRDS